jgi:hypothetical protein
MAGVPDRQRQCLVVVPARPPGPRDAGDTVLDPGLDSASGGIPGFDEALARLLGAIGERHSQLAAAIAGHGRKLREAYKHYQAAEESVGRMVDRVMDDGQPGVAPL